MKHSAMFESIRDWYTGGFWNKKMVYNAVRKKKITAAEYEEIVGEVYE